MTTHRTTTRVCLGVALLALALTVLYGQTEVTPPATADAPQAVTTLNEMFSDVVTINVQNGSLVQVLNAFSMQTGKSIVIGPDVDAVVNVRLSAIPWKNALDVILKPYGYGYQVVGDAVVVNRLEKFQTVEEKETLTSTVFNLKYLDAAGIKDMIEAQLSPRGKWSALTVRGQRGWIADERKQSRRGSGGGMERRQRVEETDAKVLEAQRLRSKTIIVVDTQRVIDTITTMLAEVDVMPIQVLIEARFVEVTSDFLQDVGVEFGTGPNATDVPGVQALQYEGNGGVVGVGARLTGGDIEPASFGPATVDMSGTRPYQSGLSLLFQQLTDFQFEVLLHMMEEDVRANLLSSPRVMTLNDQEAMIMVGTKYPIIQSDTTGSGNSSTISTSLDYYEDIGIQLNVIPQVCENSLIRMIVNPKVRTLITTTSGKIGEEGAIALTEYPVLSTREAETHILLRSGETVVIGGLLEDQENRTELRVPILGSLPLIGRLFRRETIDTRKLDLLIFLTATALSPDADMIGENVFEDAAAARIVEAEKASRARTAAAAEAKALRMAEEARREEERRRDAARERLEEERRSAEEAAREAEKRAAAAEATVRELRAERADRERRLAEERARLDAARRVTREAEGLEIVEDEALEEELVLTRFPTVSE